jgi:hypothetical protein
MLDTAVWSTGPSKKPSFWMHEYSDPERSTPSKRTVLPESTSVFPCTWRPEVGEPLVDDDAELALVVVPLEAALVDVVPAPDVEPFDATDELVDPLAPFPVEEPVVAPPAPDALPELE